MAETHGAGVVARIYGNLVRLLGGKAAAGLISLVYLAIAARALGPANYGVLVLVHTYVMTVGGLIEFPGWHAVVRYGAHARQAGDAPRLTRLLAYAGAVELAFGAVAVAVAALLAPILGPRLGWSPTAVAFAGPYSLAVLASIRATPAGYLQLVGRFDLLGLHNLVPPVVRLAGAAVVVATGAGLHGFLVVWLVAALAEWAAMWGMGAWVARGQLSRGHLTGGVKDVPTENPGLWRFMLAANADVTVSELSARVAPLAVGWMLGPAAAGLYAVAQRATSVLAQPAQILGHAAYPELAKLVAAGAQGGSVRETLIRAVGVAFAVAAPVGLLLAIFGRPLIELTAGPAFAGAYGILIWLALARTIQLAARPLTAALTALGRPGLSVSANLVSGGVLLALLPPLLSSFQLAGAGAHAVLQAVVAVGLLGAHAWGQTRAPALAREPAS
jgi:O-antigen/teichoic acid export membrane protein